jgi:hypothetical protein
MVKWFFSFRTLDHVLLAGATAYGAIINCPMRYRRREVSEKKRREMPVRILFDRNRLEEQSLMAAYELVLPVAEKGVPKQSCKMPRKNPAEHPEQLAIAL